VGRAVPLQNGETVLADEAYVRESILTPAAKIVAGYQPVMPAYQGQVTEEALFQLIAYIQSLRAPAGEAAPPPAATKVSRNEGAPDTRRP
jgi:cytochrome c oxidase subunit 2